jgi:hypothetical protein
MLFRKVHDDVRKKTHGEQESTYGSLPAETRYFKSAANSITPSLKDEPRRRAVRIDSSTSLS